jgi:hypothetical protein
MDYAWLDDVTYQDWQRYHGLMGSEFSCRIAITSGLLIFNSQGSEEFADQAYAIQNGSHPSPPINPVIPAMRELQSELEDIAVGFDSRLRRIKRTGERAFTGAPVDGDEVPGDAEFSILPIPEETAVDESEEVPPVILGRSKEQVLEALNMAEEQSPETTLSEGSVLAESVEVKSREPAEETDSIPETIQVATHHVEL